MREFLTRRNVVEGRLHPDIVRVHEDRIELVRRGRVLGLQSPAEVLFLDSGLNRPKLTPASGQRIGSWDLHVATGANKSLLISDVSKRTVELISAAVAQICSAKDGMPQAVAVDENAGRIEHQGKSREWQCGWCGTIHAALPGMSYQLACNNCNSECSQQAALSAANRAVLQPSKAALVGAWQARTSEGGSDRLVLGDDGSATYEGDADPPLAHGYSVNGSTITFRSELGQVLGRLLSDDSLIMRVAEGTASRGWVTSYRRDRTHGYQVLMCAEQCHVWGKALVRDPVERLSIQEIRETRESTSEALYRQYRPALIDGLTKRGSEVLGSIFSRHGVRRWAVVENAGNESMRNACLVYWTMADSKGYFDKLLRVVRRDGGWNITSRDVRVSLGIWFLARHPAYPTSEDCFHVMVPGFAEKDLACYYPATPTGLEEALAHIERPEITPGDHCPSAFTAPFIAD